MASRISDQNAQSANLDDEVVESFGKEWSQFTQAELSEQDRRAVYKEYFALFPWNDLPPNAVGADVGCGSGRWALEVAPRVGKLHCVDPSSSALEVAGRNLSGLRNVTLHLADAGALPFPDRYLDFAFSLGVLHHLPDTAAALRSIAAKLKPGAPLLIYIYYAFDNRPRWYRLLWKVTDRARRVIARLPFALKYTISQIIAATVYFPLARLARQLDRAGILLANWPLAYYRNSAFYMMRTDALDRFGTRLEHRFTRDQIKTMLYAADLVDLRFSDSPPYWCVLAFRNPGTCAD